MGGGGEGEGEKKPCPWWREENGILSQLESWREKLILGDFHDDDIWRIFSIPQKGLREMVTGCNNGKGEIETMKPQE